MITYDVPPAQQENDCFLCALDPTRHPCVKDYLEGRVLAVRELQLDGERVPSILLETGTSTIEVRLDSQYYRSLIYELKIRSAILKNLTLRIYHLPSAPTVQEGKNGSYLSYTGNAYTLALLEPDMLLNITDLNQAEYCARQYLLHRLSPSTTSSATVRGNLIHHCFKELLKAHDRGYFNGHEAEPKSSLTILQEHLEQALELNNLDMALNSVTPEAMREEVAPHLESLARWYESQRDTLWTMPGASADEESEEGETQSGNQVRAETFLLAPEIGLRGRLDLFWQQDGRQRLLELKTGGATGDLPKRDHRWQVYGYHALLMVRRDSHMKKALATLLYTGTPGSAQAFGIRASIREIQRVNERRNILVLSRVSTLPPAPPGVSRCSKCAMLRQCQHVSILLQWQVPALDPESELNIGRNGLQPPTPAERDFFVRYYYLLQKEGRSSEQQQALLWHTPVNERMEQGTALGGLLPLGPPTIEKDGWEQCFRCTNTSELREGDEILLSNGDPITGEVVTGTIVQSSSEAITIWTREQIAHPALIDRYDSDIVHVRTLQNLLRWLQTDSRMRDLVAGRIRPRFRALNLPPRPDFNADQNLAVERALQMQDYLLIQGPPGTGKTSVIAEIVKRLCAQNQRVLLAGFTNQAVDNMLKRLDKEGFYEYIRLGSKRNVSEQIHSHLLKELADTQMRSATDTGKSYGRIVHDLLSHTPVIASTTATWSSEKYTPLSNSHEQHSELMLEFDVAIIDEAGQLTVPAILGALRFARRFILVGDEQQLPPLVLSKEAAQEGLAESLFSSLKRLDEDYMQEQTLAIGACVALRTQYRMNKWIGNFASRVFYEGKLEAHPAIAEQKLFFPHFSKHAENSKKPASNGNIGEKTVLLKAIDPNYPLAFLDVRDQESSAKISNSEARAIRGLVEQLLKRGIAPQDIGVIAPYRAQVANIRRHLLGSDPASGWEGLPANTPLNVDTVDRFQGGERLIILMSFATTREPAPESQRREFLTNAHRLNVALTRAQRKLILLGSVPALEPLPIFGRLITYCRSMKTLFPYTEEEEAVQEAITHFS